jgi:NAD-dependent dihydropyrimidine dehydrogenase PreA subunit
MIIDPEKCNACGLCIKDCPIECIRLVAKKAVIGPDCVRCRTCVRVCPSQAVQEIIEELGDRIICAACPVNCRIAPDKPGACRRFVNEQGELVRVRPLVFYDEIKTLNLPGPSPLLSPPLVTGIGAGTTYPDHLPAPYILCDARDEIDVVTVVTEAPLSYSGIKIKVDTDFSVGQEGAEIRFEGRPIGMVETEEYGSKILAIGGVNRLTGRQGFAVARAIAEVANRRAIEVTIKKGANLTLQVGYPPIINKQKTARMRVGCGSASAGLFAPFFKRAADEVIVLDSHITSQFSHHASGRFVGMNPTGIRLVFPQSTPGRYFGRSGKGWGGTPIENPLDVIESVDPAKTPDGTRILITETTGEQAAFYVYSARTGFVSVALPPEAEKAVAAIRETCQMSRVSAFFAGGAGGSARAGVTLYPLKLTQAVHQHKAVLTVGGAPVFVLPGGGITFYVDVEQVQEGAFSWTPTPAIIIPIEYTMFLKDYEAMGGHVEAVRPFSQIRGQLVRWKQPRRP